MFRLARVIYNTVLIIKAEGCASVRGKKVSNQKIKKYEIKYVTHGSAVYEVQGTACGT